MSIVTQFTRRFDEDHGFEALKTVRHYVNTACRISRTHQHIAFSQRCRRYQVLPRSVTVKPLVQTAQGRRIAQRAGSLFLAARVQQCYKKLGDLETVLFLKRQLHHALGSDRMAAVEEHRRDAQTKVSSKAKERQKRKFEALLVKQTSRANNGDRQVVNLSSKQLEAPHLAALSKGLNFAPALSSIPKAHIVASVEAAIGRANASESVTAKARMNVIGAISRARLPPKNITSQEAQALRDLAKDEDILVLPADKGKATVVMD